MYCGDHEFDDDGLLQVYLNLDYRCVAHINYTDAILFEVNGLNSEKFWGNLGFKNIEDFLSKKRN